MEFFQANIHLEEILVQLIAFLIVFWTLKKLAWKSLSKAIEARKKRFEDEWATIEKTKEEIENLRQNYSSHLEKIEDESCLRIQEAMGEGRRIAKEIQEKARVESQSSFEKAKSNIEIEIEKAKKVLRNDIADLSIQISEKILQEKMDKPEHEKKALAILQELEKKL